MPTKEQFTIKTESFEGPLDLLLDLVEKRKLFINEISLAKVAEDFVTYLESHKDFPTLESSEFILVASTLILIKSKSLLPKLDLSLEEEESIEDLQNRLEALAEIRKLVPWISELVSVRQSFTREPYAQIEPIFFPDQAITLESVCESVNQILNSLPKKEKREEVCVAKTISLKEMIGRLEDRIKTGLQLSFSEFSGLGRGQKIDKGQKVNVIVSFLAMLELVKNGLVRVQQQEAFEEIEMETGDVGTPKYL